MDYLLDKYFFDTIPVPISLETKKAIGQRALTVVQWADWLCKWQDPIKIYENHTSFLFGELLFFLLCFLTFIHAYRHGGRGVKYEFLSFYLLHLPLWAEGPAVGLAAVMLDLPYDIMGIKLLWWTWHDTDPNIYDRMYWVPWNSYYFHASFACSFVWILKLSRRFLLEDEYDWKKFDFLLFFLNYKCPVISIFKALNFFFAGNKYWFDELSCAVAIEYIFYMILVVIADPVNIISEGLHQPIGPCDKYQSVRTPTGMVLHKKKYLCTSNYDEKYFDFHCVPNGIPKQWYAVCGTDFENRAEYVAIIW
uniref:Glycerophosphocholine acyltransferase 1 n=1 Tax=Heterorhabditis bacteriophora TaxID=37862 RepID=A0A1I7W8L3_HETBA